VRPEFDQGDPARHRALARQFQRRDRQGNAGRRSGQNAGERGQGVYRHPHEGNERIIGFLDSGAVPARCHACSMKLRTVSRRRPMPR
jgi:hypothetical protein